MSLSGKEKKRGPNWTIEERNTLIELCRASTNTLKMNWGEVADRVNSIGGNSRVAPEVKKKWTDMKVLTTIPKVSVDGIPGGVQCGVSSNQESNKEEEEEEEEEEEKDMIQGAAANVKDRSSSVKFSSCNATGGSTSNLQLRMVMAQEQQNSILSSIDSTLKKIHIAITFNDEVFMTEESCCDPGHLATMSMNLIYNRKRAKTISKCND
ncbi:hypothetical protein MAR_033265 [Mya arenaria]|uniref:Myb-like domain-containing protein n=1 Tax=Mya arenaria TaxID=6604 RepID=A0ABY7G8H7_MYAAR|nr:hypothetical protein MAR_033265 [Mya arenaria]